MPAVHYDISSTPNYFLSVTRIPILHIGDSISQGVSNPWVGHGAPLCPLMKDIYRIQHIRENGQGTVYAATRMATWMALTEAASGILFNFGLHDVSGPNATTNAQYQTNLEALVATMLLTTSNIYTLNTISVDESKISPPGTVTNSEIDAKNARLQTVCDANSIPVLDINAITKTDDILEGFRTGDGIHYDTNGYERMAVHINDLWRAAA